MNGSSRRRRDTDECSIARVQRPVWGVRALLYGPQPYSDSTVIGPQADPACHGAGRLLAWRSDRYGTRGPRGSLTEKRQGR